MNADQGGALLLLCLFVLWSGVAYVLGDFEDAE